MTQHVRPTLVHSSRFTHVPPVSHSSPPCALSFFKVAPRLAPPPLTVAPPTDESDRFSAVSLLSPIAKDDDEDEASFAASWGHRSHTYFAPASPLGSSTSEGQIYVEDAGDDVSRRIP